LVPTNESAKAKSEKRKAKSEKRKAKSEKRKAKSEKRKAKSEKRKAKKANYSPSEASAIFVRLVVDHISDELADHRLPAQRGTQSRLQGI
jgi:hypothetical protein